MFETLSHRRTIFVTGKGGVGKTTFITSLGMYLASRGRRVLLAEVDNARPTLGAYFDRPIGFKPVRVAVNLDAVNIDFLGSLKAFLAEIIPMDRLVRLILRNRIVRTFLLATPGAREVTILTRVQQLAAQAGHRVAEEPTPREEGRAAAERKWDHLIIDMPSSGHAVSMFGTPVTVQRLFNAGPLRNQAARVLRTFSDEEQTALVMVSISEEMSINETLETMTKVRAYSWPPLTGVALNRYPAVAFDARDATLLTALELTPEDPAVGNLPFILEAATASRIEQRRSSLALIRLQRELAGKVCKLPFVQGGPVEVARQLAEIMAAEAARERGDHPVEPTETAP